MLQLTLALTPTVGQRLAVQMAAPLQRTAPLPQTDPSSLPTRCLLETSPFSHSQVCISFLSQVGEQLLTCCLPVASLTFSAYSQGFTWGIFMVTVSLHVHQG